MVNSVRVVGYALKAMYRDRCQAYSNTTLCPEMETINGTLLFQYMIRVNFTDEFKQDVSFDSSGDPPAWYDILNYVGRKGFRWAGIFKQTKSGADMLQMNASVPIMFHDKSSKLPESVCSKPCAKDEKVGWFGLSLVSFGFRQANVAIFVFSTLEKDS